VSHRESPLFPLGSGMQRARDERFSAGGRPALRLDGVERTKTSSKRALTCIRTVPAFADGPPVPRCWKRLRLRASGGVDLAV
jgi:hypothetical protein